jgi:alpha-beta hydrolase superfamily lysophospholipase
MQEVAINWKSWKGTEIFARSWSPEGTPKAVLCLVHGHGEHSGRYAHVAEFMGKRGIATLALDQLGHGKSGGTRGHFPSLDAALDDIDRLLETAAVHFPDVPRFLFGHSMGGNEVLNYAMRRKPAIQGVIASAPWLKLAFDPSKVDLLLASVMVNIWPSFTQPSKLDATAISRIPEEVEKYKADPLIHDKISPALFKSIHEAGLWALDHAAEFPLPLLLAHGTADRLTSWAASNEFASKAKGDFTFRSWEGLYHEMHNEPERAEVLEGYAAWMEERLG